MPMKNLICRMVGTFCKDSERTNEELLMLYTRSKTCTVDECAERCKKQEGCHYFIVGNGKIDGVDKTGAWCPWRHCRYYDYHYCVFVLLVPLFHYVCVYVCMYVCISVFIFFIFERVFHITSPWIHDDRSLFLGKDYKRVQK